MDTRNIRNFSIIAHISLLGSQACALKPFGFNFSTTGKLPFSRSLSQVDVGVAKVLSFQ